MADFGWAYIDRTETTGSAYGENRTVQFLTGAGNTSGTLNFTYYTGAYGGYSANTLVLTGTLVVSGTVSASHYHVENVTEIDSTGSTYFGNTDDDRHIRTGSLTVVNYNGSTVALHASSSGNVGIGTDSPASLLHVSDTLTASGDDVVRFLRPSLASGNYYSIGFGRALSAGESAFLEYHYNSTTANSFVGIGNYGDAVDGGVGLIVRKGGNVGIGTTSPGQQLEVSGTTYLSGGLVHKRVITTANYAVSNSDYYVGVGSGSGGIKLTLAAASTCTDGQTFVFKDEHGHAQTNNITISGSGADTIDGQNTVVLQSNYAAVSLYCNGSNKYFIY